MATHDYFQALRQVVTVIASSLDHAMQGLYPASAG